MSGANTPALDDFLDFDLETSLQSAKEAFNRTDFESFVLDFNKDQAYCALNVSLATLQKAWTHKDDPRKNKHNTRWIHIESPEKKTQSDLLQWLGSKYGFSSRLLYSMLSEPMVPQPIPKPSPASSKRQEFMHPRKRNRPTVPAHTKIVISEKQDSSQHDLESLADGPEDSPDSKGLDLNHYSLVNDVWHYTSVDYGYDYTCISYNSIHGLRAPSAGETLRRDLPDAKRIYTWLVLCRDGTVISISENPFPDKKIEKKQLRLVRENVGNVFRQISKAPGREPRNKLEAVQVRASDEPARTGEHSVTESDSPSLLVYYLFDDWSTTYGLIARRADHYGRRLDRVRDEMILSPQLDQVHQLHYYGRQLSILKRIYKSYALIIERVLKGPQSYVDQRHNKDTGDRNESVGDLAAKPHSKHRVTYGVPLTLAAVVRFERLKDRIHAYALSEIQACLDEKESLMNLNFNLITIKESSYIERLTRITILLAKISILFIPVTFMSAYFTVPFVDTEYNPVTYWVAFAIIFTLSFVGIVIFGKVSGTQESKPIYTSLTQASVSYWQRVFRSGRGRSLEDRADG